MNEDQARLLLQRLLEEIAPDADLADVGPDEPIQEALDLDSMDFLGLMTALHDETGIDVAERDYSALSTVGGFISYVTSHQAR